VLLVAQPYRIELSLNLLLVLLATGFILGYFVVRLLGIALNLPTEVRAFRLRRNHEKAHTAMLDGLEAYFEGRYARAEKAAATAMAALEPKESPTESMISAIVAARSAHELRKFSQRDEFLAAAEENVPEAAALRLVTQAELLLDEHRPREALSVLQTLRVAGVRQHTAALRLELKAQQRLKNWDAVLDLVGQLEQRNAFDKTLVEQLRRNAHLENLKSKSLNPQALKEYWQSLPASEKKDSKLAAAAAYAHMALGGCVTAHQIIEQSLQSMDGQWDSELVGLYAECLGGDAIKQIERAETWLKSHPNDAALLLALGKLCAHRELWGKAQNYLEASLSVEPGHPAHLALAQLNEKIGKLDVARDHYCKGLELALKRLG
jgi:HemY protein